MAEVFLATHRARPGPTVVLKRILPHLEAKKDFVQMFEDEARLTSLFDHPNLVRVLDNGHAEGVHFLVMEYVDGVPLSSLVKDTPRPLDTALACWIVAEITAGLHYAHTRVDDEGTPLNIVHRDISPDNVLLSRFGEVKLADFGIAKASIQLTRTRPGQLKGKFAYMSPEQSLQQRMDHRSDVFAAGLVLYELTTGQRVFHQVNDADVLHALATRQYVPPEEIVDNYPLALAAIVRKALAWEPRDRFQSAEALRLALTDHVGAAANSQAEELARQVGARSARPVALEGSAPTTQGTENSIVAALGDLAQERSAHSYGPSLTPSEESELDAALTTPFGVPAIDAEETIEDATAETMAWPPEEASDHASPSDHAFPGDPTRKAKALPFNDTEPAPVLDSARFENSPLSVGSEGQDLAEAANAFESARRRAGPHQRMTGPLVPPVLVGGATSEDAVTIAPQPGARHRSRSEETATFVEDLITHSVERPPAGSVFLNQNAMEGIEGFPWGWVIISAAIVALLGGVLSLLL